MVVKRKRQKNPSTHKRSNGWVAGTKEVVRESWIIGFRPEKGMGQLINADMEAKGLNKQQWCDVLVKKYFAPAEKVEVQRSSDSFSLLREAIEIAIASKQAAIRAERKKKASQRDQALIGKWIAEIDELKLILPS
jgi:hypothetical protein